MVAAIATPAGVSSELLAYMFTKWIVTFIPLGKSGTPQGKIPRDKNWTTKDYSNFDPVSHIEAGYNVGIRLSRKDIVIDIDERNGGSLENLIALFPELQNCPIVETGSGWHIYLRKMAKVKVKGKFTGLPGIEIKTFGQQIVAAGSVHPNGKIYKWVEGKWDLRKSPKAPAALLKLIERPALQLKPENPAGKHTPEQLAHMLDGLNPLEFRDHDAWFRLMMSCHHATGGHGAEEFIAWSTADPKYADHGEDIRRRWESLHA